MLLELHDAVVYGSGGTCYVGTHDPQGRVFIKGWNGPQLALVSEEATEAFLRTLETRYARGMDIEAFHGLQKALSKENS